MELESYTRYTAEDLAALRDKRVGLVAQLGTLNNESKTIAGREKQRELMKQEQERVDEIYARFQALEVELAALDREIREAEDCQSAGRIVPPQPIRAKGGFGAPAASAPRRPLSAKFEDLFPHGQDPYAGRFESFGAFARAVAAGGHDERLIHNAAMTEGTGTSGGFLVPSTWAIQLFNDALQLEAIRPRCRVVPMDSPDVHIPLFDNEDGTSNARGGLVMKWMGEASSATEQAGKTRIMTLRAKKAAVFVRVSSELAFDTPNFDAQLSQAMSAAIAAGIDAAAVSGDGAGMPLGLLNSPAMISVAKVGTQGTNTLTLQNLADCVQRLTPASFKNSVWLVSPTCISSLINMAYVVMNIAGAETTGGSYVPAVTFDAQGNLRIFGKEALISDACSTQGAVGDVILFDPSRYLMGIRREMALERDVSPYWTSDELSFRMIIRMDGQCANSTAQKLANGSTTVSPIVTIASRA